MPATALSIESARSASINLVDGYQGSQALADTLVAYRANRRSGTACTKNRSEVSGSGKKLWNQKGTGRARMGSVRSPIFSGGGVVFGPRPRDYSKKIPKNVRKLALRTALTGRIRDGSVFDIQSFSVADGKTKSFVSAVNALTEGKKILIVGTFDETTFRSARNVQNVQLISASEVNSEHLLAYDKVLLTSEAIETLARRTA
ncbi:MAG: 50S ribosomal protein L4 [Verrucomicrobiales bacterium]|nr:50S ribosomal protein L4 [Verrucomicrobiales bacterium]MCP5559433.1 50S ribosomal protein L4 [Verrucomicrobiaceae bacterium]